MIAVLLAPVPFVLTLVLIVLAIVPWGGPPWTETAVVLLPIVSIYFWSSRRPHLLPAPVLFALGAFVDVMTHGPLGIWAAAALLAGLSGRATRRAHPALSGAGRAGRVVMTMIAVTTLIGVLEAVFAWQPLPIVRLAQACGAVCVGYPILAGLMTLFEQLWPQASSRSLFLRGIDA